MVRPLTVSDIQHTGRYRNGIIFILPGTVFGFAPRNQRIRRNIPFRRTRTDPGPSVQVFQNLRRWVFIQFADPFTVFIRGAPDTGILLCIRERHIQILALFCRHQIKIKIVFYFCLIAFFQYRFDPWCLYKCLLILTFFSMYTKRSPRDQDHSRHNGNNHPFPDVCFFHIKPPDSCVLSFVGSFKCYTFVKFVTFWLYQHFHAMSTRSTIYCMTSSDRQWIIFVFSCCKIS